MFKVIKYLLLLLSLFFIIGFFYGDLKKFVLNFKINIKNLLIPLRQNYLRKFDELKIRKFKKMN